GHPETLLLACAGAGPYFLFEISGAPSANRPRALRLALLSGALALGLGAVLLLPLADVMPVSAEHVFRKAWYALQKRSEPPDLILRRLSAQLAPYWVGVPGHGNRLPGFAVPASYAGALLFPFAAAGLFGRQRSRWLFLGLGLASLAVCVKTPAADWLAKLPLFDIAINEYAIFLATFAVCALAALGAARLRGGDGTGVFLAAAAASCVVLVGLSARLAPQMTALGMPQAFARERLLFQVVPIAVAAAVLAAFGRRGRAASALPILVFLFVAERAVETFDVSPTLPERAFYPDFAILGRIPRGAPYRFAATGMTLLPNAAAVYGLEDVRGYEAMRLAALVQTFSLWCVPQSFWFNRIDDPTVPFLSFLNVRWVLTPQSVPPPDGWPVLAEDDRVRLVENPRALPRAFIPRFVFAEADPGRRLALLGEIRDFAERGVIDGDGGGAWQANGRAQVRIDAYEPQRMVLDVSAQDAAVVATSIPSWPGWKVDLDGHPIATLGFNHAFLAFRAPPGSHRVTVSYAPDSVADGAAISLATAIFSAFLLLRPRRLPA
ncbi:MAG TPA: YfhO family protein, partial [Thermoanaerobaculia bacterium]|nr:YfhO family protein [Thermoanaerobaculia bacterium]